jgi:hypothetical protein
VKDRIAASTLEGTGAGVSKAGTFKTIDRRQAYRRAVRKASYRRIREAQVRLRRYYSREADFYRTSRRSSYRSRQHGSPRFNNG